MGRGKTEKDVRKAIQDNVVVVDAYFENAGVTKRQAKRCLKAIKYLTKPSNWGIKNEFANSRICRLAKTILEYLKKDNWNMAKAKEPDLYELVFAKK